MKKLISILLVAMMLIVAVPVSAEGEATETFKAVGIVTTGDKEIQATTNAETGETTYSAKTVTATTFNNGDSITLLSDGLRFTWPEWRNWRLSSVAGGTVGRLYKHTSQYVKLTTAGTGIQWESSESKKVGRIDLWIWPSNAIDTYEIQKYDETTGTWVEHQTGDLNPHSASLGNTSGTSGDANSAKWNSILLTNPIETDKLRFVVKGFTATSDAYAYITEMNVLSVEDTKNINLISRTAEENDDNEYSIYAYTLKSSTVSKLNDDLDYRGWPGGSISTDDNGDVWHVVGFGKSNHAINRVTVNVAKGEVTEFKVMKTSESGLTNATDDSKWTTVATATGNFSGDVTIDIPNITADTDKCEFWKVIATECTEDTTISSMKFYEIPNSELTSTKLQGTLAEEKVIVLDLDKYEEFEDKATGTSDIYFALYSGENDNQKLISVTPVTDVAFDDAQNMVVYKVPAGAEGTLTLRAFIWDGSESLKPLANDISYSEAVN